jgi:hypothetical protein
MLTGRRFRLSTATIALDASGGKAVAVTIPAGSIVRVTHGPDKGDRFLDVLWQGHTVEIFLRDLQSRGVEVSTSHAG